MYWNFADLQWKLVSNNGHVPVMIGESIEIDKKTQYVYSKDLRVYFTNWTGLTIPK